MFTARYFDVQVADVTGDRRLAKFVRPRQVGMWIAKEMTDLSLPEIGRRFGGKDHTTVLHAWRKINRLRHELTSVAEAIEAIRAELKMAEVL